MTAPTVSVVVSAHQAAPYLQRSLASVLEGRFDDLELIVVDDGSTDDTPRILDAWAARDRRVRVLRQENTGLTRALSRACAGARGEFIARQDADDLSLPGRLAGQAALLRREQRLSFVGSWVQVVGPRDEPLFEKRFPADTDEATEQLRCGLASPYHGSVMFRTAAYVRAGGYREAFRYAQDHDLWLRLAEVGQLAYAQEFLYRFRVSETSISAQRRSQQLRLATLARRCATARQVGESEQPWLDQAARVSAEPRPPRGPRDPGNSYFIGKCLLDRRDPRCLPYLRRALRERPWSWRSWAACLSALSLWRAAARPPEAQA